MKFAVAKRLVGIAGALLATTAVATEATPPARPWPGTFLGRLEALALVETLNATLLGARSATFTLDRWCGDHHLADDTKIKARLVRGIDKPPTPEQRQRLQVDPGEPVKFRHVELACGDHILSEADNWYVPGRLTAEMNRLLDTTDTPFGRAVADLKPYRRTFSAEVHWHPLPEGWEMRPPPAEAGTLTIPPHLFEHRALLFNADQKPFFRGR